MQRVEDFPQLFRLNQSRQKTQSKASHEKKQSSDAFTRPFIYKQIPVIVRRKTKKKKNQVVNRVHPISPYTGGPLARSAVKSGWVNRFHLSDSQRWNKTKPEKKNMAARARGGRK